MKYKQVQISDFSRYESGKSSDGGAYGFTETYTPYIGGVYKVQFYTTADFSYCGFCGGWGDCGCSKKPLVFSEDELEDKIREANNDTSDEIYAEVEMLDPEDVKVIRRRVEDALRKTTDHGILFEFASRLKVKF